MFSERFHSHIDPDDYLTWMIKRKICPHGIVSLNSRYWVEQISILDGEMGITLPYIAHEVPAIFYQALRIVREARSEKGDVKDGK